MNQKQLNILIIISLVILGVLLRFMPHPANFAPITAIAIFGGAMLPRRSALLAPLIAMITSDLVIGLHNLVLVTWGSFAVIALVSNLWLKKRSFIRGVQLTLAASVFFYAVTNFAVWLTSGMYAHTWTGLARCYYLALPFFRNTLIGDIVYTAGLFGLFYLASYIGSLLIQRHATNQLLN